MSKLRILAALMMSLLFTTAFAATEYYGRAAYGLKGNVKKVKCNSTETLGKYIFPMKSNVSFVKDGRIKMSFMYYDANGYPQGMYVVGSDTYSLLDVRYDAMNRPIELEYKAMTKGNEVLSMIFSNQYSSSGDVEKCVIKEVPAENGNADATPIMEVSYDGYKYDSTGNWIERNVVLCFIKDGKLVENSRYVENREIEYYSD